MPKEINFNIVKNGWRFYRAAIIAFLHLGIFPDRTIIIRPSKCWISNIFLQKKTILSFEKLHNLEEYNFSYLMKTGNATDVNHCSGGFPVL